MHKTTLGINSYLSCLDTKDLFPSIYPNQIDNLTDFLSQNFQIKLSK